jgi:hypothetical protein
MTTKPRRLVPRPILGEAWDRIIENEVWRWAKPKWRKEFTPLQDPRSPDAEPIDPLGELCGAAAVDLFALLGSIADINAPSGSRPRRHNM